MFSFALLLFYKLKGFDRESNILSAPKRGRVRDKLRLLKASVRNFCQGHPWAAVRNQKDGRSPR